jgi:hypothetical protein
MRDLKSEAEGSLTEELHFELICKKVHGMLTGGRGPNQVEIVHIHGDDHEA